MPEFYADTHCKYQINAQPILDQLAFGFKTDFKFRELLFSGVRAAEGFSPGRPLWQEQWSARDPLDKFACPFWANYWFNNCAGCDCRANDTTSGEIDALFFVSNSSGQWLAIHVEVKQDGEPFIPGQAASYRPRAACYKDGRRRRKGVLPHEHFITLLLCGKRALQSPVSAHFDRVISHEEVQAAVIALNKRLPAPRISEP